MDDADKAERLLDIFPVCLPRGEGLRLQAHSKRVGAVFLREAPERVVGLLHDLVEDTALTIEGVERTFGATIADAVDAITRRDDEVYAGYILRCGRNLIARRVKLADLADNLAHDPPGYLKGRHEKAVAVLDEMEAETWLR